MLTAVNTCEFRSGQQRRWVERERKDGTTYTFPVVVGGTPCGQKAVILKNGKNLCLKHARA